MKKNKEAPAVNSGNTPGLRSLRRQFLLFGVVLALVAVSFIVLPLVAMGFFPPRSQLFCSELDTRLEVAGDGLQRSLDLVAAHGLRLADEARGEIENLLLNTGTTFEELNDDPDRLAELQQMLFPSLNGRLRDSGCSGAFVLLNATANTSLPGAENSRSGLYLRCINLTSSALTDPEINFFRGMPAVARHWGMEVNNRWNMECDVSEIPGYETLMDTAIERPADACYWTRKFRLKDTWEDVVLLCVPIVGNDQKVYGLCGIEVSSMLFKLSAPVHDTDYGPVTTVLAPLENGKLMLPEGLIGGTGGAYLDRPEPLSVHRGKEIDTYTGESAEFVGMQRVLDISWEKQETRQWSVALLLPREYYDAYSAGVRREAIIKWGGVTAVFLLCLVLIFRRFLRPMWRMSAGERKAGDLSILVNFLRSRPASEPFAYDALPEEIRTCLKNFSDRIAALPNDDWRLYRFLAEGCTLEELPRRTGLSRSALRRELRKLCTRLEVDSTEDILLYLDFLRCCGQEP